MHNAAFRALGLPYVYLKFRVPVADLSRALDGAMILGFKGVNITIPLKEAVLPLVDRLTAEARRVGAVNTVTFCDGTSEGHNTDGDGFLRAMREEWDFRPHGRRAVILGAGGAARAVAFALAGHGAREVAIVNRTVDRAIRLARDVSRVTGTLVLARRLEPGLDWSALLRDADLLVNATSVGMRGESCLVPTAALSPDLRVADLVYNPPSTALLLAARARGALNMNGCGMLVHQGALAFERWTRRRAPTAAMRLALFRSLGRRHGPIKTIIKPLRNLPASDTLN
jgi:shikimate dehydrogenase